MGGDEPSGDATRREESAGAGSTDRTLSDRARRDVAGACESADSAGRQPPMNQLPYLLQWVRVLFLIRSITSHRLGDNDRGGLCSPYSTERCRGA